MSELHGIRNYDNSDDTHAGDYQPGTGSFGSEWGGGLGQPDYSVYDSDIPPDMQDDPDAGSGAGNESRSDKDQDDEYQEALDQTNPSLSFDDGRPSREEQYKATWGGSPQTDGETASAARDYDQDTSIIDDGLPTPQESRAATWGDHPQFYDEATGTWAEPVAADTADQRNTAVNPIDGTGDDDNRATAEGVERPAPTDESRAGKAEPLTREEYADYIRRVTAAEDQPDPADEQLAGSAHASHMAPDHALTRTSTPEASDDPWRQRVAELEAQNAELGKSVAAMEARLQRIEQGGFDKSREEISERRVPDADRDREQHEQEKRRSGPSDEALLFGTAAAGGVLTTVADFVTALPTTYAGIAASALAVGAAGVAWVHKRREARHADRS